MGYLTLRPQVSRGYRTAPSSSARKSVELDQWERRQVTVSQWVRPMGSQQIDSGPSFEPSSDQIGPLLIVVFGIFVLYLAFVVLYLVFSPHPARYISKKFTPTHPLPSS